MRNIAVFIKFDGTDFHGFQVQKNAVSIQATVQSALERLFGHATTVTGCSRTDSGVHAKEFCILTKTAAAIPTDKIVFGLNALLPGAISAFAAYDVDSSFHPRYSALAKEYEYHLYTDRVRDPLKDRYSFWYPKRFDSTLMASLAPAFEGRHDFAAFMASGSAVENTVRTMFVSRVEQSGTDITVRLKADGFLYNMVRIIVGTLLEGAANEATPEELLEIIESKDRTKAGFTAPAHGLFLTKVEYEKGIFDEQ